MSASRSARQLLSPPAFLCPRQLHHRPRRLFHTTPNNASRRKAPRVSIQPSATRDKLDTSSLLPYTEAEKAQLAKQYTPKQLAAIEASEAAIDLEDLLAQGVARQDPGGLKYIDNLSKIQPVIDRQPEKPRANYDPKLRLKTKDELVNDLAGFVQGLDNNETGNITKLMRFHEKLRVTVGKPEAELDPRTSMAPHLPRFSEEGKKIDEQEDDEFYERIIKGDFVRPEILQLMNETGLTERQLKRLRRKTIVTKTVSNQTRMGKQRSYYIMSVVGDGNGMLGVGEGKSLAMQTAQQQAFRLAVRNMKPVKRYERRTIFGEVKGKVGATELTLMTRPPGFGIRCMHYIFEICRCAGITDLAARVSRARNPMNIVKATVQALQSQRDPEEIAVGRGVKLVDVRKVYYGGNV